MSTRNKPRCADGIAWLRNRIGRDALAPLTGQDRHALEAYLHLLELYFTSDANGADAALLAIGHTLSAAQPSVWPVFKAAIPWAADWHNEDQEWPRFVRAAEMPQLDPSLFARSA